ncbi:dnaJ homolog subfamily C member 7 isoform X3 [Hyalella azteca]|uniref:DnaJ homolog subfamily C member 7 isoform X3 n=1 Tax=Hyalella azteca TaxID=294128 RepID=A0A8B7NPF2_HYAAZ|nr:dnaJ homolog subfamily C member 7 isoform X3 [Hyalella azteca]
MADISIHEEIILSGGEDSDVIMEEEILNNSPKRRPSAACVSPSVAAPVSAVAPEVAGETAKKRRSCDDEEPNKNSRLAERKKAEGNEAYRNKEYRDALQHYTQAIELCPDCAAYYSNRSACYMMLGRYRDALNDAQHAVALDQHFVKGWIRVGKCHVALGDGVVALSVLRRAQDIEPSNSTVHQEIASAQALLTCVRESQDAATKSDYRTAVFHLDQALRYALGGLELRITKAEYLTFLGRASEAEDIVNDILVSDNNHADALYVRGLCRYYQDNQDAAFQHFQKVLRLVPDHNKAKETYKRAKLLNQKKEEGNAAFKMGDFARAYDIYSEALKIDVLNKNTNSKLYCNRATVAAKLGRLEQAISDCTAALQLDDSYVKAYLRRANTYQQTEQYEEAVRDLEKVYRMQRSQEHKRLLHEAKTQLKRSKRKDYYKILGVSKTASDDEIKKAYRKMALLHHPDRHSSASAAEKAEHERKFKELGEAYAVLTDPKKRGMHDRGQDVNDPDCGGFRDAGFDPNQVFEAFFGSDFFASQSHHYYDQGQAQHQHQQQQPHFQSQFQGPHPGFQGFPGGFQYGF